jgi:hypothetical protein
MRSNAASSRQNSTMHYITFSLNNKPMSQVVIGGREFPAFSGLGDYANKRQFACLKGWGPIPPGSYFVVDRQSGGLLGPVRDIFNNKGDWMALYADDGTVNDEMLCNSVKRGNFRLHPKGPLGRSEGCITVDTYHDFQVIRSFIRTRPQFSIPNSQLKAYAKLDVQ